MHFGNAKPDVFIFRKHVQKPQNVSMWSPLSMSYVQNSRCMRCKYTSTFFILTTTLMRALDLAQIRRYTGCKSILFYYLKVNPSLEERSLHRRGFNLSCAYPMSAIDSV